MGKPSSPFHMGIDLGGCPLLNGQWHEFYSVGNTIHTVTHISIVSLVCSGQKTESKLELSQYLYKHS